MNNPFASFQNPFQNNAQAAKPKQVSSIPNTALDNPYKPTIKLQPQQAVHSKSERPKPLRNVQEKPKGNQTQALNPFNFSYSQLINQSKKQTIPLKTQRKQTLPTPFQTKQSVASFQRKQPVPPFQRKQTVPSLSQRKESVASLLESKGVEEREGELKRRERQQRGLVSLKAIPQIRGESRFEWEKDYDLQEMLKLIEKKKIQQAKVSRQIDPPSQLTESLSHKIIYRPFLKQSHSHTSHFLTGQSTLPSMPTLATQIQSSHKQAPSRQPNQNPAKFRQEADSCQFLFKKRDLWDQLPVRGEASKHLLSLAKSYKLIQGRRRFLFAEGPLQAVEIQVT